MRRVLSALLVLSLCLSATSQEARRKSTLGNSAGYATRSATVLSMMGWGFLLAGGIATICILIENDEAHSHSH